MPHSPLIAGVELGGTKINCILARGPDAIEEEVQIPTTSPEETLTAIEAVLERWKGFEALGIASFGPISIDRSDASYGHVTQTPKPGWSNTDIAGRLGCYTGVPTGWHTDVVGAALAEARWGAAKGMLDLAYVTVGTGIGVALLARGRPVEGLSHSELGHMRAGRLGGDDWPGTCPFHGDCLEGLAAGPAIANRAGKSAQTLLPSDPVWAFVSYSLGQLLHNLVLTGVPRRIIMGGGVMMGNDHLFPLIRAAMIESLAGYLPYKATLEAETFVVPPKLGNRAGPLGAIILGEQALLAR